MAPTPLAVLADVQAFYKLNFASTTRPTDSEVTEWLAEATSIIYGELDTVYDLPDTPTAAEKELLRPLKALAIQYARINCDYLLGLNTRTVVKGNVLLPRGLNHKSFYDNLMMFKDGIRSLDKSLRSGILIAKSYNSANSITAEAQKEEIQW